MLDYFVDANATGTGDGLTPANAFVTVASIPWNVNTATRAWVRNTQHEFITRSVCLGSSIQIEDVSRNHALIGWPSSNKFAYYDERPSVGVSAGWDADVPSTAAYSLTNMIMPTIGTSDFMLLGWNTAVHNFFLTSSSQPGGGMLNTQNLASPIRRSYIDHVMPLYREGPLGGYSSTVKNGKLFLLVSSAGGWSISGPIIADQIEVHSLSQVKYLFNGGTAARVGHLINYSNSIAFLSAGGGTEDTGTNSGEYWITFGRVSGIKPYSGDLDDTRNDYAITPFFVDDWYGEGPRIIGSKFGRITTPRDFEATHSGELVSRFDVQSVAAGLYANSYPKINPIIRAYFDVISGQTIGLAVPVYIDSTAAFSLSAAMNHGNLQCAGGGTLQIGSLNIIAGDAGAWTGSLIAGGTAYTAVWTITPEETATNIPFDFFALAGMNVSSGAGMTAYALFGRPYNVQSG